MSEPTATPASVAELRKASRKYARAQAARDAALAELLEACKVVDAEGALPRKALAAEAGLSKQTVYDALAAAGRVQAAPSKEERLAARRERLTAELAEVDRQATSGATA